MKSLVGAVLRDTVRRGAILSVVLLSMSHIAEAVLPGEQGMGALGGGAHGGDGAGPARGAAAAAEAGGAVRFRYSESALSNERTP
jgi:hypothetical protein